MGGHLSNLMGTDYESTVARIADRLARRHLGVRNPAVVARAKGSNATLRRCRLVTKPPRLAEYLGMRLTIWLSRTSSSPELRRKARMSSLSPKSL